MTAAHNQPKTSAPVQSAGCTAAATSHAGLENSAVPELRKLAEYEQLCGGAIAERSSFFAPTPATISQAVTSAKNVAATLKAYAHAGVEPIAFMEPTDLDGHNLDLSGYAQGSYDGALEAYFAALQAAGITSQTMGMCVFVPEGNLPIWSTVDPAVYSQVITRTATAMKRHFPDSQASIMLDSKTYPVGGDWGSGNYVSLLPYVQNIPKGLIDSFGLQGFPWTAPANQTPDTSYDPRTYLRSDFAIEAARALHVSSIWFNTGTFGRMYANQAGATVSLNPVQRQAMLDGVVQLAAQTKASGFTVAVHLFAQNKANLSEGTDWSYWPASGPQPGAATPVFTTFAHNATAKGIKIWLYDTTND